MCFSPAISFSASAGLAVIGVMSLRKVTTRYELLLALIPMLFAIQQLIEGTLWLILFNPALSTLQYWLVQAYTFFAGVIWPILVPLSLWGIEPESKRKKRMLAVLVAGISIAFLTVRYMMQFSVSARIGAHCILYEYPVQQPHSMLALYVVATCGAFFCSSARLIVRLGWIYIASFFITYHFYHYDLTSVWCFFAAVISGFIYLYLKLERDTLPR
jgi:hypothetical protein